MNFLSDLSSKDTLTLLLFLIIAFILGVLTWYLCRTKSSNVATTKPNDNDALNKLRSDLALSEKNVHSLRNETNMLNASIINLKKEKTSETNKLSMSAGLDTSKENEEWAGKVKLLNGEIESLKGKVSDGLSANERMKQEMNKAVATANQYEVEAKQKAEIEAKYDTQAKEIVSWKSKYDEQLAETNKLKLNTPERPNVLAEIEKLKAENAKLNTDAANHFELKSKCMNLENENAELKNKLNANNKPAPMASAAPVIEVKAAAPVVEAPKVEVEVKPAPVVEAPKMETPIIEAPKVEVEAPKMETPIIEAPKVEVEAPKMEPSFVAAAPIATVLPKGVKQDDLKMIEGIGPKIESVLQAGGIVTWLQLSQTSPEKISETLLAADDKYRIHDPATWPEQADLLAKGEWDAFEKLTQALKGGRRVD